MKRTKRIASRAFDVIFPGNWFQFGALKTFSLLTENQSIFRRRNCFFHWNDEASSILPRRVPFFSSRDENRTNIFPVDLQDLLFRRNLMKCWLENVLFFIEDIQWRNQSVLFSAVGQLTVRYDTHALSE